jgi:uncharacterized protein YwbE
MWLQLSFLTVETCKVWRYLMAEKIKVYLGNGEVKRVVEADLVEDRPHSVLVKLEDGNVIKRKKSTQVVKEEA